MAFERTHIMHTFKDKQNLSWCGEEVHAFAFVSLDHAAYNAIRGGRLLACADCVYRAIGALTWTKAEVSPEFSSLVEDGARK